MAMTVALALALAPLAMPGQERTVLSASHHGQVSEAGHCDDQPQPDQADNDCCVAGCAAVAALPTPVSEPALLPASRERPAPDHFRRGYVAEIATPPPRIA